MLLRVSEDTGMKSTRKFKDKQYEVIKCFCSEIVILTNQQTIVCTNQQHPQILEAAEQKKE